VVAAIAQAIAQGLTGREAGLLTGIRHDTTTASRVVHVAMEPRDHVHMKMFDGLARRRTGIEANVEAVRVQLVVKLLLYDVNELASGG
jgi:hypothetical protein